MRAFTASVTGTAAQVTIQKGSALAPNTVIIQNPTGSGQTLYVGGDSGVTTSTGLPVVAGAQVTWDIVNDELWLIGSGSITARLLARA